MNHYRSGRAKRSNGVRTDPFKAAQHMLDAAHGGALGEARRASNHVGQRFSRASSEAASNLLTKAVVRLDRGDERAARAFIARALDLPYDDHEENEPALWEVHMMLYTAFSDDLEGSEHGDLGWLDRAEAVVRGCDDVVRREVQSCLASLFELGLSSKEQRRLRSLVGDAGRDDEPFDGIGVAVGMLRALLDHAHRVDVAAGRP